MFNCMPSLLFLLVQEALYLSCLLRKEMLIAILPVLGSKPPMLDIRVVGEWQGLDPEIVHEGQPYLDLSRSTATMH